MANTIKLARTFEAWVVTIEVKIDHFAEAFAYCKDIGIRPEIVAYLEGQERISFFVTIPVDNCQYPDDILAEKFNDFVWLIDEVRKVSLICP